MSTDTQEWTEERIGLLRKIAEAAASGATSVSTLAAWERFDENVKPADVLSLLDALEHERERAEGLSDAFNDLMDALAVALEDGAEYAERPAEVVWRLRNQRDEAVAEAEEFRQDAEIARAQRDSLQAALDDCRSVARRTGKPEPHV